MKLLASEVHEAAYNLYKYKVQKHFIRVGCKVDRKRKYEKTKTR